MGKIIKEVATETMFTLELSQKELNTIVRLIGNTNTPEHNRIMGNVRKEDVLTKNEADSLYYEFANKATYAEAL